MYTKQVTATHKTNTGKQAVWTDDSEQSLEDWKKKPYFKDYTFSELEDNPEVAKAALVKSIWDAVKDPAVKKLLKPLLKEFMNEQ